MALKIIDPPKSNKCDISKISITKSYCYSNINSSVFVDYDKFISG